MTRNLFIAYDLLPPGQNYDAVQQRIQSLGQWYKLQYSLYYVHTVYDMQTAHDHVRGAMDAGDQLAVIEANNAFISNVPSADLAALRDVWAHN